MGVWNTKKDFINSHLTLVTMRLYLCLEWSDSVYYHTKVLVSSWHRLLFAGIPLCPRDKHCIVHTFSKRKQLINNKFQEHIFFHNNLIYRYFFLSHISNINWELSIDVFLWLFQLFHSLALPDHEYDENEVNHDCSTMRMKYKGGDGTMLDDS